MKPSVDQSTGKKISIIQESRPFIHFLKIEVWGGIVLLVATIVALAFANLPWANFYFDLFETKIGFFFHDLKFDKSINHWVNDGLMTIFFFVVGLEIKREIVSGELKDKRNALFPIIAAFGGMIVPAAVYAIVLLGHPGIRGWGIPMATDIAFVVGFLSLFGNRVPHGLRIFVLSLAIVDDIGAVIVIAIFYSKSISFSILLLGLAGFVIILALNKLGARRVPIYIVMGFFIWWAFLCSGIHPTVAGVLLGLFTPASAFVGDKSFTQALASYLRERKAIKGKTRKEKNLDIKGLINTAKETISPLERLELELHPWVALVIMPIFALANAGIRINQESIYSKTSIGVILGLAIGKPVGILLFAFLAVKLFNARLPQNTTWLEISGVGFLAGIGFTMSIFIASLALSDTQLLAAKTGTLLGSCLSVILGFTVLFFALPKKQNV
jgi:Na+:H+ antiporter, NhaA family